MTEAFLASRRTIEAKRAGDPDQNPEPHHVSYDERVVSQPRDRYVPPAFLKKTASPEQYAELEQLFGDLWAVNEEFVGERTREAQYCLAWEGRTEPINRRLMSWVRSYFGRRMQRDDPRDKGNRCRQFHRLLGESIDVTTKLNAKGSLDYVFLHRYDAFAMWLLCEGTLKKALSIRTVQGKHVQIVPTQSPFCLHCIDLIAERNFHRDILGEFVGKLRQGIDGRPLPGCGDRSQEDMEVDLLRIAADLRAMRPYLLHNFNPAKTIIEVGGGVSLAWDWRNNDGIGTIKGGDSRPELLRSIATDLAAFAAKVDEEGRLTDLSKPWIHAGECGSGVGLGENLYVLGLFHDRLLSFYDRIDFEGIRRRAIGLAGREGVEECRAEDPVHEAVFSLSCEDLSRRVEQTASRRIGGMLRIEPLIRFLVRSFGCEVRQGKGSEVSVHRPGVRQFTLGCHGKNPEVPSVVVRRLLRRLEIPEGEWLKVVYS